MNYYVGIDLGGTNTKIGLVDEAGNIIFATIVVRFCLETSHFLSVSSPIIRTNDSLSKVFSRETQTPHPLFP